MTTVAQQVSAYVDDALGRHDAVGLVGELQAGRVGVGEVTQAAIARVEAVDPLLGAMAWRAFDSARVAARDPHGGFFAGVPTVVKDNCDAAGMPTMHGTDAWLPRPVRRDGDLARLLRATGLVAVGHSRMSEYGLSAAVEHPRLGPVRNPWATDRTAGASSAGAAALVASGALPLAHANDGGGSIRIPAAVTGLVGLKPTRGRLPQDATLRGMPLRIVADGVLTRSVRDTAAFLREAETVWRNRSLPPVGDLTRPGRKRLRVALVTVGPGGEPASPEMRRLALETAALLESLGHHVEAVAGPAPAGLADDFLLYWAFLALALVRTGRRQHGPSWAPDRLDGLTHGLADHASRRLHRVPGAIRRLRRSGDVAAQVFTHHDVTLSPTLAHGTPPVGHLDVGLPVDVLLERLTGWVAFTPLHNVTGEPAVSLPLATSAEGLPVGMMFGAPAGREPVLVELAYELEGARPWGLLEPAGTA